MVKKIVFSNMSKTGTYYGLAGIRFFDEVGERIINTPIKSNSTTKGVFEKLTVTTNTSCYSSSYYPAFPFDTAKTQTPTSTNNYWMSSSATIMTVTFNNGFEPEGISSIQYNCSISTSRHLTKFKVSAYNEYDLLLGEYDVVPTYTSGNKVETLETPKFMAFYEVDRPQLITTNDATRVTDIPEISTVTVVQREPEGTRIRYAFSFDMGTEWYTFKNGVWSSIECSATAIDSNGMSKEEVEELREGHFRPIQEQSSSGTFDFAISMSTSNIYATPSVKQVQVSRTTFVNRRK